MTLEDIGHATFDLDKADFSRIKKSAEESDWLPEDYTRNDWVSEVCMFLREGPESFINADYI